MTGEANDMASKSEQAYAWLRDRIIAGDITPDAPLRVQTLGQETGFGSIPVREALRRLEAEKLVVSVANIGFRSAAISLDEVRDLERSRFVIESALLKEAIAVGQVDWESEIVAAHYQLARHRLPMDTADPQLQESWARTHQQFHDALLSASQSIWLKAFHRQISQQLDRIFRYTMAKPLRDRMAEDGATSDLLRAVLGIESHTALMQATLDRDEAAALALLDEHIQNAPRFFDAAFAVSGGNPVAPDPAKQSGRNRR